MKIISGSDNNRCRFKGSGETHSDAAFLVYSVNICPSDMEYWKQDTLTHLINLTSRLEFVDTNGFNAGGRSPDVLLRLKNDHIVS